MEIHNMERKLPKGPKNLKSSVLETKKGEQTTPDITNPIAILTIKVIE